MNLNIHHNSITIHQGTGTFYNYFFDKIVLIFFYTKLSTNEKTTPCTNDFQAAG